MAKVCKTYSDPYVLVSLQTLSSLLGYEFRADARFVSSQWETALLCNDVSHWLGASLESALWVCQLQWNQRCCILTECNMLRVYAILWHSFDAYALADSARCLLRALHPFRRHVLRTYGQLYSNARYGYTFCKFVSSGQRMKGYAIFYRENTHEVKRGCNICVEISRNLNCYHLKFWLTFKHGSRNVKPAANCQLMLLLMGLHIIYLLAIVKAWRYYASVACDWITITGNYRFKRHSRSCRRCDTAAS